MKQLFLVLVAVCLHVQGCVVYYELRELTKADFKREYQFTVSDTSLPGDRIATFEVVGDNVTIDVPDNTDYVTWEVNYSQLNLYISDEFPDYELNEKSKDYHLGWVYFKCGTETTLKMRMKLKIKDTNNHPPEFVNPDEYVYQVKFPLVKGSRLRSFGLGPLIQAYDVDLNNKNVTFTVFETGRQALNAKPRKEKWDLYGADIKILRTIYKPTSFNLIAMDTGNPQRLSAAVIQLIDMEDL